MHTIIGANGVVGRELSKALLKRTDQIRQVSRTPRRVNPSDEAVSADLLDPDAVDRAVAGSEVAYLVAGLKYDTAVWRVEWPRIMRNVIDACKRHGARLVFLDNVYAYGHVTGAMTEETPFNPSSLKGEIRARIATTLLDEMRSGGLQAMIVRAADFYGPGAISSLTHVAVFDRLKNGKKPQWIGDPKTVHTFSFTPDVGSCLEVLGRSPEAYGQTWHAPTSPEPRTGEEFVRLACELAGRPYSLQVAPGWLMKIMGWFNPVLKENEELMYQFDFDYRFDSGKIAKAFGLEATPYRAGVTRTLEENAVGTAEAR